MIADFAKLIPESMEHSNGRVFYSGREAFGSPSRLYVLGINPGGAPEDHPGQTVHSHTKWVMECAPCNWSAYRDERWHGGLPGESGIQPSLRHLFCVVGLDPGTVPASNIVFARSSTTAKYPRKFDADAEKCWAFHREVIDRLSVEVVVVVGNSQGAFVRERLKTNRFVKRWIDKNARPWKSAWYRNFEGRRLSVVVLAHPTRGHQWTRTASDPTALVHEALNCY